MPPGPGSSLKGSLALALQSRRGPSPAAGTRPSAL